MRSTVLLVSTLVLASASAVASAQATETAALRHAGPLTWDAARGCPSVDELWARIDDLASDAIVVAPISVQVVASAGGHTARVRAGDAVREIRAATCDLATSAIALVIATTMMVQAPPSLAETAAIDDGTGPFDEHGDEDVALEGSLDDLDEASDEEDAAEANTRDPEDLRATGAASVGVAFGPLPDARPVSSIRLGMRTGGFELDFAWFHSTTLLDEGRDAGGALIRMGWVLNFLPFEFVFQVAGQVGVVWEARANIADSALWGAVGAGLEGRYWLDDTVGISISGDMLLPVSRYTAPLVGEHVGPELPTVTVRLGAGVVVQID